MYLCYLAVAVWRFGGLAVDLLRSSLISLTHLFATAVGWRSIGISGGYFRMNGASGVGGTQMAFANTAGTAACTAANLGINVCDV